MSHTLFSSVWNGDSVCFHCGAREKNLPNDLDVVLRKVKAFATAHRYCRRSPPGAALEREHDEAYAAVVAKREALCGGS